MNGLMAALISRNPTLGGVVMANKGGRVVLSRMVGQEIRPGEKDIIRLRPPHGWRVRKGPCIDSTSRATPAYRSRPAPSILVDTAAALNPKDEKSFFKIKGAAHIGRTFELLAEIGRPITRDQRLRFAHLLKGDG